MSLNGVGGVPGSLLRPQDALRPRIEHERSPSASAESTKAGAASRAAATGLLAPRQDALSIEAPSGTDPALWEVLTAEERAYFAKMSAMGPLTYGRPSRPTPAGETPLARGGRIDVRV